MFLHFRCIIICRGVQWSHLYLYQSQNYLYLYSDGSDSGRGLNSKFIKLHENTILNANLFDSYFSFSKCLV